MRFDDFLVVEGIVVIEIYAVLAQQLEVFDFTALQLTQQKHDLYNFGYAFLSLFYLFVLHLFWLQFLVQFGQLLHQ